MYRKRALSIIEDMGTWTPLNPLFKEYINYLECICGVGVTKTLLDNYVCRNDNFELEYAQKICVKDNNPTSKVNLLTGFVGKGKTTFVNFVREKLIPKFYPEVISIYIDLTSLAKANSKLIDEKIIRAVAERIKSINKMTDYELQIQYLIFNGFPENTITNNPTQSYKSHISVESILLFLDSMANGFHKVIFFFDNIDENKRESLEEIKTKLIDLIQFLSENTMCKSFLFVVSMREYNKRFFTESHSKTYSFPNDELPEVDYVEVVKSKFKDIKNEIEKAAIDYTQPVYFEKYYRLESTITITKEKILFLLDKIVDILFKNKSELITYINSLSAGNLKTLSFNILNLLQSKNLPLLELFESVFKPQSSTISITKHEIIGLLMAIKYPYFDVETSHILNIFNINSSHNRNDFRNILLIPRMLFYIYNHRNFDLTFFKVKDELKKYGYDSKLIDIAIDKCFGRGLFQTKFGIFIYQIDQEKDFIKLGRCGLKYTEDLIYQFSYLQYVCEDTPVSPENYIAINKKYYRDDIIDNEIDFKKYRISSVKLFMDFIEKMEKQEISEIEKQRLDRNDFLDKFCPRKNNKGIFLSSIIKEKVNEQIALIERN